MANSTPDNLAARLSVGAVSRSRFEEAQRLQAANAIDEPNQDTFHANPETGLIVVADGLGGYSGGALASQLIVRTFVETVGDQSHAQLADAELAMRKGLAWADSTLFQAKKNSEHENMGATVVAAQITLEGILAYLNAGNSALLVVRAGKLILRTTEQGNGPFVHNGVFGGIVRTCSSGYRYFDDEYGNLALMADDRIVLATDGFFGSHFLGLRTRVEDKTILEAANLRHTAQEAATNLADASTEVDDTTVVVVDYERA